MTTTRETADHIGEANEKVTADHAELSRVQAYVAYAKEIKQGAILVSTRDLEALLSEIAALRAVDEEGEVLRQAQRDSLAQAERQRDELRKALERAADDLRDIGGQSPRPTNSPDPEHENYLRRVLISLAQVGNTRARQALANQGAE